MSNKAFSDTASIPNNQWLSTVSVVLILISLLLSPLVHAHRGPANEIDNCRILVGSERIHFSAYTPTFTKSTSYCQFIPNVGPTNLVFDYEGHKLRDVTVEFEITKEPDGTRIFYQEPKKIKTGTLNTLIDFSKHGAGDYLAHVTIMYKGEKQDTHLPFAIGSEEEPSYGWLKIVIPLILVILIAVFSMREGRPKKEPQE